ncbi:uncharacterized protein EAF01_000600 [Botrytis porri]|uniref:Uncharacterized protein n=1 Tax=Botrytis porri TaxID=87229 RepID=A0A4Z1JLM8_9HELO|nr:uncharacterized protein EAF01_000600 [Botrytis porri]KAF7914194.1 hypothetical protein EAF01_000600 [Botrytis porri]TGO74659.1 hypothetical protein BPOR_2923g00010 [Botrytis porri]
MPNRDQNIRNRVPAVHLEVLVLRAQMDIAARGKNERDQDNPLVGLIFDFNIYLHLHQSQGPRAPGQLPLGPIPAPRYPQEPPHASYCPAPPFYCSHTPVYSLQTEISKFERDKLWVIEKLTETTRELALQVERHNNNVDAMRYQTPVYYPEFSFLPTYNI